MKENKGLSASLPGGLNFGVPGKDGATFTPSLDDEGNLSWSNDKGLPNPEPKNIRGPQGPAGEVSDDKIAEAVKEYMDENPAAGSGALTSAQIDALHGMFKVCVCDDSKDVSGAYAAFKTAFGITDSGEEEPDEPVTPEKTLTGISAVYSGGDVAVGTAVADLAGIVVTAHYSDGTSEPVTGYTLSGEIAEGENTVTVSYGGKTATFTVTGVAESGGIAVTMLAEFEHDNKRVYVYTNDNLYTKTVDETIDTGVSGVSGFNWYSDEGNTAFSANVNQKGKCFVSENEFAEDTNVKILIRSGLGSVYDSYVVGCTDWDGSTVPSSNNVYHCQKVGNTEWKAHTHEIEYTVKAGTRLLVANTHSTEYAVDILTTDATLNALTYTGIQNYSFSEDTFEADTVVRITAAASANTYDKILVGCSKSSESDAIIDIVNALSGGDSKWENPYAMDFTYTVKAGYRLCFGSYWNRSDMDTFVVEVV